MDTLHVTTRKAWRSWLARNHGTQREIWLVYARKHTGKPRISYNDAVEEALCYGWIDSTQKRLDDDRTAQRFSPRRKVSGWSELNKQRARKLIEAGRMTKAGLDALGDAAKPKRLTVAPDIRKAIDADADAKREFRKLPADYKAARIAYIEAGRRHGAEQFRKRLDNFVRKTAAGKRIGMSPEYR